MNFIDGERIFMHLHQVRVYYEDTDAGGIVYMPTTLSLWRGLEPSGLEPLASNKID